MGFGDVFKASENKQLKDRVAKLEAMLTPEMRNVDILRNEISHLENEKASKIQELNNCSVQLSQVNTELAQKRSQCAYFDEEIMFESFGLYTPRFNFAKAEQYKAQLDSIRQRQKAMISGGTAVFGNENWTVNGSVAQGKKMVKDMQKLLLRAFNSECDELVEKVKYNNFEASLKRINSSCDAISKLGTLMQLSISPTYRQAKIDELTLAFEYAMKKQQEKEEEKEARARMREEAKLLKEIEEERKRIEKEQTHYQNALARLNEQLAQNPNSPELLEKKKELEYHITDAEKALKEVDYRAANKRAGYVYVISNIGAFGENVYKIGMTRRLDPQERVDELGDASVPFGFDVHAMIFSDDAPALEAALHRAFEGKKVNMVNPRREFFRVTLDEIKAVVRQNYDKTVEFTDVPDAEQWRVSVKMRGETPEQATPHILQAAETPVTMPSNSRTFSSSTTAAPTSQKNLAEMAIDIIKTKYSTAECTYSENHGIFTVIIKNSGRLRISDNGRIKCDYMNKAGKVVFFEGIDKINQIV